MLASSEPIYVIMTFGFTQVVVVSHSLMKRMSFCTPVTNWVAADGEAGSTLELPWKCIARLEPLPSV